MGEIVHMRDYGRKEERQSQPIAKPSEPDTSPSEYVAPEKDQA